MPLQIGSRAPDFSVMDVHDRVVRLSDAGGRDTLLCFYRYAGCPYCNLSLKRVIEFQAHVTPERLHVIAFFQSPTDQVLRFPGQQNPPFPLVADPNRTVYDLYQVESSVGGLARSAFHLGDWFRAAVEGFPQRDVDGDLFLMPAQFLVAHPGQQLAFVNYWRHLGDELPFKEIEHFLRTKI